MKTIAECWEPCEIQSHLNKPHPAVSFDLHKDGSITNAVVSRTSGIMSTDLSCLDSVLVARPDAPNELCTGTSMITCDFFFLERDSSGTWAATGQRGKGTKLESTVDCPAGAAIRSYRYNEPAFLFHIIPSGSLSESWFTKEEIHNESNLGALKLSCAEQMIREIRNKLTTFEASNKPCNRASLLEFRKRIFDE